MGIGEAQGKNRGHDAACMMDWIARQDRCFGPSDVVVSYILEYDAVPGGSPILFVLLISERSWSGFRCAQQKGFVPKDVGMSD